MSDTGIVRTAFDGVQQKMGVELMDWEGWYWPNHFGDPVAEHNAVREHVGVWDESPLRKWGVHGPVALAAADRIFTNDMLGLEIGQVRYAPFCDEEGNMVGDGTVFKFTDTSCWVITALDSSPAAWWLSSNAASRRIRTTASIPPVISPSRWKLSSPIADRPRREALRGPLSRFAGG